MRVYYSPKFKSRYKKLSPEVKQALSKVEKIFLKNPFDPKLRTHKLTGKLKGLWAFSIDRKHRIVFEFIDKNTVELHSVGSHDIYKN